MYIIIPGAYNAQTGISGASQQSQTITIGSMLKVTERGRKPLPSDPGVPTEIWLNTASGVGYICKESNTPNGTVWDKLDVLGDYIKFGDADPDTIHDIKMGYRPGSLRYARNSQTLWINEDNSPGAAVWTPLSSSSSVISVNGQTGVVQLYLDDLLDVDAPTPLDGEVLTWDAASSTWMSKPATGGGSTYTVDNGLTESSANNFQWGGTLLHDTLVDAQIYTATISTTNVSNPPLSLINYGAGPGLLSRSVNGLGGSFVSNPASTNTIVPVLKVHRQTTGTAANGIGASIDMWVDTYYTVGFSPAGTAAGRLITKWTNAALVGRTSQIELYNVQNMVSARKLALTGAGQLILDRYGVGNFTDTTAYLLGADATGNIIEVDAADFLTQAAADLLYYPLSTNPAGYLTSADLSGYVPNTRTLTINSTTYDLSANRSWSVGDILSSGSYVNPSWITSLAWSKITGAPSIPTVGTWGALNYPTWVSGTPFVKMTAAGTFALDTNTYLTSVALNDLTDVTISSPADDQVLAYDSATSQWINQTITAGAANQMVTIGRNSTGSTLYQGTIVYISGSTGNRPNFVKAQANAESTSAGTFGVIKADIANNADGECVTIGTIDNLDTRSSATNPFTSDTLVDGDTIYLSPTTAGYITRVKPYAPNHLVYIGKVVRTSPTNGTIVYRIQNGYELDEIHDVSAQSPANKDGIFFNTATQLWEKKSIGAVLGGTTSQYVKGDASLGTFSTDLVATSIYQQDVYIAGTTCFSVEYVPSVSKVYVANNSSGTVSIFDATNGDLLSSVVVTAANKVRYISSINEVWVTSSSATTITRISPSGNTSLGTITGLTTNGVDILEYSSTKVFVTVSAGTGSIMVINPSTLSLTTTITTNVPSFCYGMALNTNVASSQYDKIIITALSGIAILTPSSNTITTTVTNPSSAFNSGRSIVYSATNDKYYAASIANNRLVVLSIASSTTFTATFIQNQLYLSDLVIDESNDFLFTVPQEGGTVYNVLVKQYKLSTMSPIIAFRTSANGGANTVSGYIAKDTTNKRLFVVGRNSATNSSVCLIKYI